MDESIIERVRKSLVERCTRIEAQHDKSLGKATGEDSVQMAEIIDIAQNLEQLERDISIEEKGLRELASIQRALEKISSGKFGVCEDCSEEIPVRRLMALPYARLCTVCQMNEEKRQLRGRSVAAS